MASKHTKFPENTGQENSKSVVVVVEVSPWMKRPNLYQRYCSRLIRLPVSLPILLSDRVHGQVTSVRAPQREYHILDVRSQLDLRGR